MRNLVAVWALLLVAVGGRHLLSHDHIIWAAVYVVGGLVILAEFVVHWWKRRSGGR